MNINLMYRFLLVLIPLFGLSQEQEIHEFYPQNQEDYIGGNKQFYKEFHDVLIEKKMQPCENKNELYTLKLIIYPDKTIKYLKDDNTTAIEENKCTYELSREVVKYMDNWQPAIIDGKPVAAVARFDIFPDALFEKYKKNYDIWNFAKKAEYKGGIQNFTSKIKRNINVDSYRFTGDVKVILSFKIKKDGSLDDIIIKQSSGLEEFDEMLVRTLKKIKNEWKPATIHGQPVDFNYSLPISFYRSL